MSKLALNGGESIRTLPFPKWPIWTDDEINNLIDVIKSDQWGSIKGTRVNDFEKKYAAFHDAKYGVCVNSGTTALTLALRAVGIGRGDEVLVPAYTFIATATSIVEAGAIPRFVDIDPETYNIDVNQLEANINERTKGIMPVHFGGRPAEMDVILSIAEKNNLKVVEDAAQAWGSEWKQTKVGAIGNAGCFSFQSSKNMTSAEGGIILTNEDETEKYARSFSNCGRLPGGVWYEHYYLGGNFRLTEFQAAILDAQFDRYPKYQKIREQNCRILNEHLSQIDGCEILKDDPNITANSRHLYIWRYKKEAFNNAPKSQFIKALQKEGIITSAGYSIPLYTQPVMKNKAFGPMGASVDLDVDYASMELPETEKACYEEAIWFPQFVLLGDEKDIDDIVKAIKKIQENANEL
ncbi:aminotransferase class I/II-fold pyridoxal phosphate-dependent enzyme [candidate division KSB1 bacterium]|nr:aminotransferase class I/II-fold pyridoxal phosphate-dependent enzyme [candidate division KSB1 bacterium]